MAGGRVSGGDRHLLPPGSAEAEGLKPRRGASSSPLLACTIAPLSLTPMFASPEVASEANASEADDDVEEEEEEEEDEETLGGFRSSGDSTCIAVTASLNSAVQYTRQKVSPALKSQAADPTSFLASATVGVRSSTMTADGTRVDLKLAVLFQSPDASTSGVDLREASIAVGAWNIGFAPSVFNFWTGDEFLFGTRIPARSGVQLSRKWQLTETWSATVSLEDSQSSSTAPTSTEIPTTPGPRVPDIVGRIRYEGDSLEAHLSAGVTEVPSSLPGAAARWGHAAMAGARWSLEFLGLKHALTGQAAWAVDAPVYLGTQSDLRIVRSIVAAGDTTRGFSGIVAWTTELSDTVSVNLYASHLRLDFPKLGQTGGTAELSRGAANLVWTPTKGLRVGAEAGISRAKLDLPGRLIANDPSGRQMTAILWIDRSF